MKPDSITIIILAGGKSSRMGQDKGLLKINDKTMIEHVIAAVKSISNNILVITANQEYRKFKYPIYSDIILDKGPLGGIYTGLQKSKTEKNLFLSCDVPYVETKMLAYLIENSNNNEITVGTANDKLQPLLGLYSKTCLPTIEQQLNENKLKISDLFEKVKTKLLPLDEFDSKNFLNLNSPSDL